MNDSRYVLVAILNNNGNVKRVTIPKTLGAYTDIISFSVESSSLSSAGLLVQISLSGALIIV